MVSLVVTSFARGEVVYNMISHGLNKISSRMTLVYVCHICIVMEPITNLTQTRSLQLITHTQAFSKKENKKEKLRKSASVSYSSTPTRHEFPKVLSVLPADDTTCLHSVVLPKEDSDLELPGIESGEGRSCGSEVRSKVYMQVIIHAQVWMVQQGLC